MTVGKEVEHVGEVAAVGSTRGSESISSRACPPGDLSALKWAVWGAAGAIFQRGGVGS